ncbi:hypothetical protein LINPERHAP1_LOCUS19254 [Linum perenne]
MQNNRQEETRVTRCYVKNGTLRQGISSSAMSMPLSRNRGGNGVGVWQFETTRAPFSHIGQVGCREFWRSEREKCWLFWML